jgi:hypothetical protein
MLATAVVLSLRALRMASVTLVAKLPAVPEKRGALA